MKVTVLSREAAEKMIAEGRFPDKTAVISFYDPAIKRIDEDYSHIDYSGVCKNVFYSELDDLDLEVLRRKGYTYDTYFPEAPAIAGFIYEVYDRGDDIICQCEYGQSRSAGTAAAILEHFENRGITIFTDYRYYPNQVIYHKIYDELEKVKFYHNSGYYYAADKERIKTHIKSFGLDESILADYDPENLVSVAVLRSDLERRFSECGSLCRNSGQITEALLRGEKSFYASFTIDKMYPLYDRCSWDPAGVMSHIRFCEEYILVKMWFRRIRYFSINKTCRLTKAAIRRYSRGLLPLKSFSFFGRLVFDEKRKMIIAVPLIITNMQEY